MPECLQKCGSRSRRDRCCVPFLDTAGLRLIGQDLVRVARRGKTRLVVGIAQGLNGSNSSHLIELLTRLRLLVSSGETRVLQPLLEGRVFAELLVEFCIVA